MLMSRKGKKPFQSFLIARAKSYDIYLVNKMLLFEPWLQNKDDGIHS